MGFFLQAFWVIFLQGLILKDTLIPQTSTSIDITIHFQILLQTEAILKCQKACERGFLYDGICIFKRIFKRFLKDPA